VRKLGALLMLLGVLVGGLMAYFVSVGGPAPWGLRWAMWVGMIKLGLAGSLGLIGAGAFVRRVAIRREQRARAPARS
jgi:hypothetical protein